jgi:hypothetical protein
MELEYSSPYAQVPATCPYPEPTPSSRQIPLMHQNTNAEKYGTVERFRMKINPNYFIFHSPIYTTEQTQSVSIT